MPKRLGYKTDACMMLIRREINEHMIETKENKSGLVNRLLLKWYEGEVCPKCLGGAIHSGKCETCGKPWIQCHNGDANCADHRFPNCDCTWSEIDGF